MKYWARLNNRGNIIIIFTGDQRDGTVEVTEEIYNLWKTTGAKEGWIYNNGAYGPAPKPTPTLQELKALKMGYIKQKFMNAMADGVIDFTIPSSNTQVKVDARRSNTNNDLQNVEGLIEIMQLQNIPQVEYKCYDNNKYVFTLQDLVALKYALMNYGLQMYAKKHALEDMVEQATTSAQLDAIVW